MSQREIYIDTPGYLESLRSALRESPDVILLGEMRDYDTISSAMTAAETGVLLLSTLHTSGAANTINRILDVFPANQQQVKIQLAQILKGIVCQQLVPSVDGGLIPVFEIMKSTVAVQNMIRENKLHQLESVMQAGAQDGMCTMDGNPMKEGAKLEELSDRLQEAIVRSVRHSDTVAKYGKGQYLVLLVNTTRDNCSIVQKRIDKNFLLGRQRTGIDYAVKSVIISPLALEAQLQ